ncbi:Ribonuclease H [Methylobacterium sp. 4-46]|uniref:ribonuclease HII n=1 Tax=unclassified Methylobacterium TaxID=2615210 RepID=UPI000152D18D|nr:MULTISPECIES: ribonuclease HII [Methylobacterium]ACA19681.1 Ribonuclease H [Methylobacterium sp. 4-46]WFT78878.1 ribonuclease HII [Methylobacterium nodulans]
MKRPFLAREAARYPALIGCDEVGRGALCGPVIVAAVHFDPAALPPDLLEALDDSKRLDAATRARLAARLPALARIAYAGASRDLIDRINVRAATLDAMARAVLRLGLAGPVAVDGRDRPPGLDGRVRAVIGGERLVPQIAAASILAKVLRDRLMAVLARRHPAYAWARNAGYGTAAHRAALLREGPSPHHRRSFRLGGAPCHNGAPDGP